MRFQKSRRRKIAVATIWRKVPSHKCTWHKSLNGSSEKREIFKTAILCLCRDHKLLPGWSVRKQRFDGFTGDTGTGPYLQVAQSAMLVQTARLSIRSGAVYRLDINILHFGILPFVFLLLHVYPRQKLITCGDARAHRHHSQHVVRIPTHTNS